MLGNRKVHLPSPVGMLGHVGRSRTSRTRYEGGGRSPEGGYAELAAPAAAAAGTATSGP